MRVEYLRGSKRGEGEGENGMSVGEGGIWGEGEMRFSKRESARHKRDNTQTVFKM